MSKSITIEDLRAQVDLVNIANRWYDGAPYAPEVDHAIAMLALVVTEASEAIEEVRNGHPVTERYYSGGTLVLTEGEQFDDKIHLDSLGNPRKPEGVPSELADIIIRVLDLANRWDINIESAIMEKLAHNLTRGKWHGGKAL